MSAVACHSNIRNTNVSSKLMSDGPAVSVARDLEVRDVGVNPTRVAVQQRCNSHPPWRRGVEGRGGRLGGCASNRRATFVVRGLAIARSSSIRNQEDFDTSRLIVRRRIASSVDLRGYWTESLRYCPSNTHCLKMIRVADPWESRSGVPTA
jgi:hypothetical protein